MQTIKLRAGESVKIGRNVVTLEKTGRDQQGGATGECFDTATLTVSGTASKTEQPAAEAGASA